MAAHLLSIMRQHGVTPMQALTGQAIAHPERLLRNLIRPRPRRRRRGTFGLVLGFVALAGILELAVRFLPLSHPALPEPPTRSVYSLG